MHISLTERLDQYVRDKVNSGLYNNASEVVREALRDQIAHEQTEEVKFDALKAMLDEAWEESERGDVVAYNFDALTAEIDAELNA
jgi:antitoxin ParD1/3/4